MVLAVGQWLLADEGLLAVAVLGPALVAAVGAHEWGLKRGLFGGRDHTTVLHVQKITGTPGAEPRVVDLAIAVPAVIHGFGPGPEMT